MTEILLNKLLYIRPTFVGWLDVCFRNWINFYALDQDCKLKLMKRWQQLFLFACSPSLSIHPAYPYVWEGTVSTGYGKVIVSLMEKGGGRDDWKEGCRDRGATREMKDRWIKCMWEISEKILVDDVIRHQPVGLCISLLTSWSTYLLFALCSPCSGACTYIQRYTGTRDERTCLILLVLVLYRCYMHACIRCIWHYAVNSDGWNWNSGARCASSAELNMYVVGWVVVGWWLIVIDTMEDE